MEQIVAEGATGQLMLYMVLGTLLFTLALRMFIKRDQLMLVIVLAFCATLMGNLNSLFHKQVGFTIRYWSNVLCCYLLLLGTTTLVYDAYIYLNRLREKADIAKAEAKLFPVIIYFTLAYSVALGGYYGLTDRFWTLLTQTQFLKCVGIIFSSLVLIFLVERSAILAGREESTRRKLFHLAPLIVVPIIYSEDIVILVAILTTASFVFLALEIVRYCLLEIRLTSLENKQKEGELQLVHKNWVLAGLSQFYRVMGVFNSRQPYFWFTHLFLILSLQLAYNMQLVTRRPGQGHIVLVLIAADAMAALIGKTWGKIRIFQNKTLEGLLAFVTTVYCLLTALNMWYELKESKVHMLVVAIACGITEVFSGNADNVTTLLVYWVLQSRSNYILGEI